jgi:hypothetical protein
MTGMLAMTVASCRSASGASMPVAESPNAAKPAGGEASQRVSNTAAFAYRPDLPLGHPAASLLVNKDGSPRIENPAFYDAYWRSYADDVRRWSREPGIAVNPNFALALFAKESGFDPRATSNVPANGVAQMTPVADADLLRIAHDEPRWQWLASEASSWPRHPLVHDTLATKARTDGLLKANTIDAHTEYFFNPGTESRASMLWLRMLADTWRGDLSDRSLADVARQKLNKGKPLRDDQIFDLVTVSYNQGAYYVLDLVKKYGVSWTKHLNEESADYLDRIRMYTIIFQNAH